VRELLRSLQSDERIILEAVLWAGVPSRHELLLSTGFTKTKLNEAIANLIASGWLEEGELQDSRGGRPPLGLRLAASLGYVIGVDLGATGVDVILSDLALEAIEVRHADTDVRHGPGTVMPVISRLIAELLETHHLKPNQVLSLGFGIPSPIEFETGVLINPILMAGWEGFSLRDYFASSLDVPVAVDNDANVMALGELWHTRTNASNPDRRENFLIIKLGTGIGAGIVARGEIYRGADGAAGDIGHNCVDPHGPRCVCGNFGCLEVWAGANSIIQSATDAGRNAQSPAIAVLLEKNGLLRKPYLLEKPGISIEDVARAAREGDHASNEIIQDAGSRVGQVLAGMVNFFNPARILIGGRVARIGPLMLSSIRQSVYARSLPLSTRALRIDYTRLGDESGMRGACALALLEAIRRPELLRR
jgi:predicted NBD/HSP70 family sugar kinase